MRVKGMRVAIIGGAGQMGEWFSRFFLRQGADVVISGRRRSRCIELSRRIKVRVARSNIDAVKGADLIIISVPIHSFEEIVKELGPHIKEGQRVIDITSVKAMPVRVMHRYIKKGEILGTHPMFGPSAKKEGQNFILTPTNARERRLAREMGRYLRSQGFRVHVMPPEKHDSIIGHVLSLTHFVGLVTASAWKELGIKNYADTTSTSFRFLFEFVQSVLDSNPELYSYLQMEVPKARAAELELVRESRSWLDLIKRQDRKEFAKRMLELRAYANEVKKKGGF